MADEIDDDSAPWIKGLNQWAQAFVKGEPVLSCVEEVTRVYPDGRREKQPSRSVMVSSVKTSLSGERWSDSWDEYEHALHKYTFPDGRVYFERVQHDSGGYMYGPTVVMALQDSEGRWLPESLWSERNL